MASTSEEEENAAELKIGEGPLPCTRGICLGICEGWNSSYLSIVGQQNELCKKEMPDHFMEWKNFLKENAIYQLESFIQGHRFSKSGSLMVSVLNFGLRNRLKATYWTNEQDRTYEVVVRTSYALDDKRNLDKASMEFLKAKCLMNSEVALILERKYEQLQQMSEDPSSQVSQVFEKSLQYVRRFSRYKNPDAVKQVRDSVCLYCKTHSVLSRNKLAEFELCVIGNLCPETVEEAKAMVPSIKTKGRMSDDEKIEKMLSDLAMIKRFE
eukprot:Gb_13169 [translate_table: standard]